MPFAPAVKRQVKLRLCIFGPSGSGKTMSALRIATGMGGKVALIDTEHASAAYYADRFKFDTVDLADRTINGYTIAIDEAAKLGYPVLIVDSLTHAWQELLEQVDKWGNGNNWAGWRKGSPEQKRLIESILSYPGHLIATMRVKTEWNVTTDDRGKTKPVKLGLAPEQGKGIEYEFGLQMEINADHIATVTKDRTGKFQDKMIEKPGEDFGRELVAWLNSGEAPAPMPPRQATPTKAAPAPKPDWKAAAQGRKPAAPASAPAKPAPAASADNGNPISEKQGKRLYAIAKGTGEDKGRALTDDELKAIVLRVAGVEHSKDIGWKVYEKVCEEVARAKLAEVVENQAPAEEHPNGDEAWNLYVATCPDSLDDTALNTGWFAVINKAVPGGNADTFTAKEWQRVIDYINARAKAHQPEPEPEPVAADPADDDSIPF
jgi:hypothetical protein